MESLLCLKVTVEVSSFSKALPHQNKGIKSSARWQAFPAKIVSFTISTNSMLRKESIFVTSLSEIPKIQRCSMCYIGIMFLLFLPYFAQAKNSAEKRGTLYFLQVKLSLFLGFAITEDRGKKKKCLPTFMLMRNRLQVSSKFSNEFLANARTNVT